MSYESDKLQALTMPSRQQVEQSLLKAMFRHGGVIEEFAHGEKIVDELADDFQLSQDQRSAVLKTTYQKENRVKKAYLWHRLLYRAADSLARSGLISRPTETFAVTGKKEWMLTENGFDRTLYLNGISLTKREQLSIKSLETQKVAKEMLHSVFPIEYSPFDLSKNSKKSENYSKVRARGFRQAVLQAYNNSCAFCGFKMPSPNGLTWGADAAHIVPHSEMGRDDLWNGLSLCHLHHWAFDVGWLALGDDLTIQISSKIAGLPEGYGRIHGRKFIDNYSKTRYKACLPNNAELRPHTNSVKWHRENIFFG
ncbi:MAG TPA: HNH endonuclease [Alicycliphilus sp.]|nr:HNH endonuclease [Alicycliphilus sp.]